MRSSASTRAIRALLVAGLGWVAACARAPVPSPAALAASASPPMLLGAVSVPAGEELSYRVTVGPFGGGRVVIASAPARSTTARLAMVRARIATGGLAAIAFNREADERTWIDLARGVPVRFRSRLDQDGAASTVDATFDHGRAAIELVEQVGADVRRKRQRVPGRGAALNVYSALYALREWSAAPARPVTIDVLARSRLWRASLRHVGVHSIETKRGRERAVRVDGLAWRTRPDGSPDPDGQPRRFRLFFSADRERRPLRFEIEARFGMVRAELVAYRAGL